MLYLVPPLLLSVTVSVEQKSHTEHVPVPIGLSLLGRAGTPSKSRKHLNVKEHVVEELFALLEGGYLRITSCFQTTHVGSTTQQLTDS